MRGVLTALAATAVLALTTPATAQDGADWREVAPQNLLVIDTSKGRVLVELAPAAAPLAVERISTLANQGFYDGVVFHRVIQNFMAQTGDPDGDGSGGSDLPNVQGEFTFRRGMDSRMTVVAGDTARPQGLMGVLPVTSQPDAQMFVTADNRVPAFIQFCPGVLGMARTQDPNSANSQWFIMTGVNDRLNGAYTAFGRVVAGLDVAHALKAGPMDQDGRVGENPDTLTRVRTADQLAAGERPSVRVLSASSPRWAEQIQQEKTKRGLNFSICDIQPVSEVTAG